jgi:hypothetical protein
MASAFIMWVPALIAGDEKKQGALMRIHSIRFMKENARFRNRCTFAKADVHLNKRAK